MSEAPPRNPNVPGCWDWQEPDPAFGVILAEEDAARPEGKKGKRGRKQSPPPRSYVEPTGDQGHPQNDTHASDFHAQHIQHEYHFPARTRQDSPEAEDVAREIVRRNMPKLSGGRDLFDLARAFAAEFGTDCDPMWFRPFVDEWRGWLEKGIEFDHSDRLDLWATFLTKFRSVRLLPGEAWSLAVAAMDDEALSEGVRIEKPDRKGRAVRLARLFRWLSRFHGGREFYLSFNKIREAMQLPSNTEAGRVAYRLEKPGLIERVERGKAFDYSKATTWRWKGPA